LGQIFHSIFITHFALLPLSFHKNLALQRFKMNLLILLSLLVLESTAQVPNLFDALRKVDASKSAANIESDPTLAALAHSGQVQTVFAVPDDAAGPNGKRQEAPAA